MNTETTTRRDEGHPERMTARNAVAPRVDIYENAEEFLIVVDLPGVARDSLQIDLDKGQLVLRAERKLDTRGAGVSVEFGTRSYLRTFALPRGIEAEKVAAELKDGVLTLHLPKLPSLKPRRIEVRAMDH
jgi:HSP20 family molecular chaperone IbpA